jgi:hypothetical protein
MLSAYTTTSANYDDCYGCNLDYTMYNVAVHEIGDNVYHYSLFADHNEDEYIGYRRPLIDTYVYDGCDQLHSGINDYGFLILMDMNVTQVVASESTWPPLYIHTDIYSYVYVNIIRPPEDKHSGDMYDDSPCYICIKDVDGNTISMIGKIEHQYAIRVVKLMLGPDVDADVEYPGDLIYSNFLTCHDAITSWYRMHTVAMFKHLCHGTLLESLEFYLRKELAPFYAYVLFNNYTGVVTATNIALINSMQKYFPNVPLVCGYCAPNEHPHMSSNPREDYLIPPKSLFKQYLRCKTTGNVTGMIDLDTDINDYSVVVYKSFSCNNEEDSNVISRTFNVSVRELHDKLFVFKQNQIVVDRSPESNDYRAYMDTDIFLHMRDRANTLVDAINAFRKYLASNPEFDEVCYLPIIRSIQFNKVITQNKVLMFISWDRLGKRDHVSVWYLDGQTVQLLGKILIKDVNKQHPIAWGNDIRMRGELYDVAQNFEYAEKGKYPYYNCVDQILKLQYKYISLWRDKITYRLVTSARTFVALLDISLLRKLAKYYLRAVLFN